MKSEKTEINNDGISVKKAKKAIYFLCDEISLVLIFLFKEFFISKKIIKKNINKSAKLQISNN
tara:strand:+ start:794 stop:982 length:189 start_codon:yes stop_codon:yes gene_type:complete